MLKQYSPTEIYILKTPEGKLIVCSSVPPSFWGKKKAVGSRSPGAGCGAAGRVRHHVDPGPSADGGKIAMELWLAGKITITN